MLPEGGTRGNGKRRCGAKRLAYPRPGRLPAGCRIALFLPIGLPHDHHVPFIFRRRHPEAARPYRTIGYPFVPLIFLVASVGMLANALVEQPVSTLIGFGLILAGVPVYYIWQHRR